MFWVMFALKLLLLGGALLATFVLFVSLLIVLYGRDSAMVDEWKQVRHAAYAAGGLWLAFVVAAFF